MVTDVKVAAPNYTIQGVGPYAIPHEYSDKSDLVVVALASASETVLVLDTDWTVAPEQYASSGNVTLSAGAASTHDGATLIIRRATTIEQGWAGSGAREKGLERQLDRAVQALQDGQVDLARALKLSSGDAGTIAPPSTGGAYYLNYDASRDDPFFFSAGPAGSDNVPVSAFMADALSVANEAALKAMLNLEAGTDYPPPADIATLANIQREAVRYTTSNEDVSGGTAKYTAVRPAGSGVTLAEGDRIKVLVHDSAPSDTPVELRLSDGTSTGSYMEVRLRTGGNNASALGSNPTTNGAFWLKSAMLDLVVENSKLMIDRILPFGTGAWRMVQRDAQGFIVQSGLQFIGSWTHSANVDEVVFQDLEEFAHIHVLVADVTTANNVSAFIEVSDDNGASWKNGASDYSGSLSSGSYEAHADRAYFSDFLVHTLTSTHIVDLIAFNDAATPTHGQFEGGGQNAEASGAARTKTAFACDAFRLVASGGEEFTGGSVYVWGSK